MTIWLWYVFKTSNVPGFSVISSLTLWLCVQKIAWDTLGVGHPIDKSRDYVYCIWVFTELNIKYFRIAHVATTIGISMVMYKTWVNRWNKKIYTKTTQQLSFCIHKPKSAAQYRGNMVHPWPHTPQGVSVSKPGALLIILSLMCKSDTRDVHGKLSNPFQLWKNCTSLIIISFMMLTSEKETVLFTNQLMLRKYIFIWIQIWFFFLNNGRHSDWYLNPKQ